MPQDAIFVESLLVRFTAQEICKEHQNLRIFLGVFNFFSWTFDCVSSFLPNIKDAQKIERNPSLF